jgi:hypothetical protein
MAIYTILWPHLQIKPVAMIINGLKIGPNQNRTILSHILSLSAHSKVLSLDAPTELSVNILEL